MNSGGGGRDGGGGTGLMSMRSIFTLSQWQEPERQALIFKYMMAGFPVPPDLVLPIQRSVESISHRSSTIPPVIVLSMRRRWTLSRGDARRLMERNGDAPKTHTHTLKYCECHMHRG